MSDDHTSQAFGVYGSRLASLNPTPHIDRLAAEGRLYAMQEELIDLITQREVGIDTESFEVALRNTLRQAPDVIMIGEDEIAQGIVTPAGVIPRTKRFTVSGIYRVGMYEFDRRLAFINLGDAQRLYRKRDAVSGVRLAVTETAD